ncbi:MAG: 54S ribosomal protein L2 mitochondrial [Chaenotheca gracillima]|nr:MAG: 54S ribosomal protein L2 mitochondrial [Chaenotheca gracillima]
MRKLSIATSSRRLFSTTPRSRVVFPHLRASATSNANSLISSTSCFPIRTHPSPTTYIQARAASHKAQGVANGAKDGPGKRLGAKKTGEQYVIPGNIIFRQRGTLWFPGENVGMGRDHTIFARQTGYVKYYADPNRHPHRKYIGVVFNRDDKLPRPPNAARKRRFGLEPVPLMGAGPEGDMDKVDSDLVLEGKGEDATTIRVPSVSKRKNIPDQVFTLRPGYSYRQSNFEIGRAAEKAKIKVRAFKPGDRFAAWRKSTARKAANAEKRTMKKKGGKSKSKK